MLKLLNNSYASVLTQNPEKRLRGHLKNKAPLTWNMRIDIEGKLVWLTLLACLASLLRGGKRGNRLMLWKDIKVFEHQPLDLLRVPQKWWNNRLHRHYSHSVCMGGFGIPWIWIYWQQERMQCACMCRDVMGESFCISNYTYSKHSFNDHRVTNIIFRYWT